MLKKITVFILICVVLNISMPIANGDDGTIKPIKKLGRGIANVITSPIELFKGMYDANEENGMFAAYTWGVLQGLYKFVGRAGVGVYEIVTFPIPVPKDYRPILTDPEFFVDDEEKNEFPEHNKK